MHNKRDFSIKDLNKAGDILKSENPMPEDLLWAESILSQWRGLHWYPLNTFQSLLRKMSQKIPNALVAQRLKRAVSIVAKLKRFSSMKLARMQDIGGLRAIVDNVDQVYSLFKKYKEAKFAHKLVRVKDYIKDPKDSGYRGIHLVYKYYRPKKIKLDGLSIEIQLRTKIQHSWATTVETVGTFLQQSLKSSQGAQKWLDYFKVVSSAFAILESCPVLKEHRNLDEKKIFKLVKEQTKKLQVITTLTGFTIAAENIIKAKFRGDLCLIKLDMKERMLSIRRYKEDDKEQVEKANKDYREFERQIREGENLQVVLVKTGSITSLKQAYPNYFLDAREFIKNINEIIKRLDNFDKYYI